ncbi:winged helix-turn-helix domain-containing protein [Marilutibacter aestuarii]|uniref:OmpR/PhoB-type domain-containing protein n=1 Tax=Marilutibacter aestuarii TaxID=1706195 RepID=A0A508AB33_9GAMM|nr:winged helix-turn-helix domain-containing protein [Lysobacter aestuarii]TQD47056.1 hypothetical protein FKV25_06085 [Lysobacter aestuarii]
MRLPRYRFGEFELDPASRELSRGGEPLSLPPKSLDCLIYLIAHRERAVGRDELIAAVWGRVEVSDTVVAQTLLRARKRLGDTGNRQAMIRTVPRFGYQWVAATEALHDDTGRADDARMKAGEASPVPAVPDAPPSPSPSPSPPAQASARRPRWRLVVAVVLLVVIAAAAMGLRHWQGRQVPVPPDDTTLVLPVRVTPAGGETGWVRLGAMEYIANRLRRAGLKVLPSDQTLHLSVQFDDAVGDGDLARLQAASGARRIVLPQATQDAQGWRVRLDILDGDAGQSIVAQADSPLAAAASASDSWLKRSGHHDAGDGDAPSPLTERVQRIDAELLAGQLAAARDLIEAAPPEQRADPRLLVREGQLEYRAGRMDQAERLFSRILALPSPPAPEIRAKALMGQGAIAIRRQSFAAAEAHYTQALDVLESTEGNGIEDPALLGNAYNGRGVARVQQRHMEAAIRDMGLARVAMQRSGDYVEAATVGANLGRIELLRGHYPQALQEFDQSIAVFERFDVRDYLAATLMAKAEAQLTTVQPAEAVRSIEQAAAGIERIEDAYLASRIRVVEARVELANGHLDAAAAIIAGLDALDRDDLQAILQELGIRLRVAQGRTGEAATLARESLSTDDQDISDGLALAAIQAALRTGDSGTATAWQSRLERAAEARGEDGPVSSAVQLSIVRALIHQTNGEMERALEAAAEAAALAERDGSPKMRVEAGLLRSRLLAEHGQGDGAAAILGDLDTFARSDYGVAWMAFTLYQRLGEPAMATSARTQLEFLRGERDIDTEPLL